ncbi:MAG: DUF6029 family protein [Vicingaceae bacterium]
MKLKTQLALIFSFGLLLPNVTFSQNIDDILNRGEVHGNFQMDMQYYQEDSIIGATNVPEDLLMNGFANFNYTNGNFSAGFRYESYLNTMLGFPPNYKGNGIGYRYASFTNEEMKITVGNYYEQFGNGLIFRSYEARGLGFDNAMDGIRINYKLAEGLNVKGIIGKQRFYFDTGEGIVRGIDGELMINDFFGGTLKDSKTKLTLGGSFISKFQPDQNSQYNLPENVGSYAGRFNLRRGKISLIGEYAKKINDPSADNNFIYKDGEAFFAETGYSTKGFGLTLSAKGVDNMSFRSDRNALETDLQINYLPALTRQHTYNLLATLYPYATQPNGEVAFQGELIKKFKKKTFLGGKYGTSILLNYSTVFNIDSTAIPAAENDTTRIGYNSNLFAIGDEKYYEEFNVEITKKFSKKIKGTFTYSNIVFNQAVVQGKEPASKYPDIYANVGVIDITYKLNKKHAIRTEVQGLFTKQDQQDWATILIEYTYSPHWFIAIMDQYNYGNKNANDRVHYYFASAGYSKGTNRIQLGYGRQRAGIFCVGGVCRNVPAASGLTLSITSSF